MSSLGLSWGLSDTGLADDFHVTDHFLDGQSVLCSIHTSKAIYIFPLEVSGFLKLERWLSG